MGLQIKSSYEVLKDLIDWTLAKTDQITDFNVGSAVRTLYEAIAIQFEEFYYAIKQNTDYAIENSIYDSFGFDLKLGTASTGYVTIAFEEPLPSTLTFPKGTMFCTSDVYGYIYFESTEDYYAERGLVSCMIPVQCKTEGKIGNVPSGAISTIVTTNEIIKSVGNEANFTNGTDIETSTERKKRFQNYIKTLARATADSIVYGCLEVDGVSGAWCDDHYIGYVKVYVHNSDGELPQELKEKVEANLENYRAGGIEVEVLPVVKTTIDVSVKVMIGNDYDTSTYSELISALLVNRLNEYQVSQSFYVADIIHAIKTAYDDIVVNVKVLDAKDIAVLSNAVIRAGDVKAECINAKNWRE